MGLIFNSIEQLTSPIFLVDERRLSLSAGTIFKITNARLMLVFLLEGTCDACFPGGDWFHWSSGDLLITTAGTSRSLRAPTATASIHALRVLLEPPALNPSASPERDIHAFLAHHFTSSRHLPGAIKQKIKRLIGELREEAANREIGYRHAVQSLATQLLIEIVRTWTDPTNAHTHRTRSQTPLRLITRCRELVSSHYHDASLTLGQIAWKLRVSEEYLARVFKKQTGLTVFEYVRQERLEAGKDLLLRSDLPVSHIASATGFSSPSYFTRCFTKEIGLTPTAYRANQVGQLNTIRESNEVLLS